MTTENLAELTDKLSRELEELKKINRHLILSNKAIDESFVKQVQENIAMRADIIMLKEEVTRLSQVTP